MRLAVISMLGAVLVHTAPAHAQLVVGSNAFPGGSLWALDVATPVNNRSLGLGAEVFGVAADDTSHTMYFASSTQQLWVAPYSPTGPLGTATVAGSFTIAGTTQALAVQGLAFDSSTNTLYGVALGPDAGGIYSIDVENLAACTLVRSLPGSGDAPGFDYNPNDDSFYMTTGNSGMASADGAEVYTARSVYRFHKPLATSKPTLVTTTSASSYSGLAAVGNLLYLCNANNGGVAVYDMFAGTSSTLPFSWDNTGSFAGATWAPGVVPTPSGADISVVLTSATPDPMLLPPGGNVVYSIVVRNNGPNTSGNIILQDTLPTGMSFVSATPGTWTNPSGTVRQVVVSPLASGAAATYTLTASPTATGAMLNKVYANNIGTGGAADPRIQNNRAVWSTVVRQPGANLQVAGTAPANCSVTTGGVGTFTFSVLNAGDIAASSTQLVVPLPSNVSFVSSTPALAPVGGVLTYPIGALATNSSASLSITVAINSGRAAQLVGTATTSTVELNAVDNVASLTTELPGVVPASAPIRALYTTVRTVNGLDNPTSVVPGLLDGLGNAVHFVQPVAVGDIHLDPGRPYASPSGSKFIQFWDTDLLPLANRHIVLRHDVATGTGAVVVQSGVTEIPTQQGTDTVGPPYYPFALTNLASPTFRAQMSINDAGNFAFGVVQDSRFGRAGQSAQSSSVVRSVGGTLSLVAQSMLSQPPAPYGSAPNTNKIQGLGCAQIAADNSVAILARNVVPDGSGSFLSPSGPQLVIKDTGATLVATAADPTLSYPAPGLLTAPSVWSGQSGGTTYPIKTIFGDAGYNTTTGVFWNQTHSRSMLAGVLNSAPFDSNGVIVVDGAVVLQGGQTLPGFTSPIKFFQNPSNFVPIAFNGNFRMEADGTWFATGRNVDGTGWVVRNGIVIAASNATITPASSLRWTDGSSSANPYVMYWGCGNSRGDYAVYGHTTDAWSKGSNAIVLNGTTVVAQTGDPVDLNGNGVFDDHYYISAFGSLGADGSSGEEVFMSADALYVLATVMTEDRALSCGAFAAPQYAMVRIPLPAGACCTGSVCVQSTQASCPSGFQGLGTACSPTSCAPAGVCCRGTTCNASIPQAACTATAPAGAQFNSLSTVCNAGSAVTPCCYADFNKNGSLQVQDIFDFLNAWFAGSQYAKFGGNGLPTTLLVQDVFDFLNAWFAGCS